MTERVLDARGLLCPLPVIELARLVAAEPGLRRVVVLTTDPAAAHDIPAWCRMRGHAYEGASEEAGHTAHAVVLTPREPAAVP